MDLDYQDACETNICLKYSSIISKHFPLNIGKDCLIVYCIHFDREQNGSNSWELLQMLKLELIKSMPQ